MQVFGVACVVWLRGLPAPATPDGPSVIDQIVAMVMWCTLGNFMVDNIRACPNARFLLLETLLKTNGSADDNAYDVVPLWDRWDSALNVPPWRKGLEDSIASNEAHLQRLKQYSEGGVHEVSAVVFENFCRCQNAAVGPFLKDPNLFVRQNRYINGAVGIEMPMPILRLEMNGFTVRCGKGGRWVPMWEGEPGSAVSQVVLRRDRSVEDFLVYAAGLERLILLSDLVIADQEPPRGVNRFAQEDIELFSGKKPLWVI
jgi:hypothetical protein